MLALLCLAPGGAIVTMLRARAELGLIVGASLAASTLVAQSMLWLGAWKPNVFTYLLAIACLPPLLLRLASVARDRRTAPASTSSDASRPAWTDVNGGIRAAWRLPRLRRAFGGVPPGAAVPAVLLIVALGAWAAGVVGTDLGQVDGFGLVSALPLSYFLALGALLIGLSLTLARGELPPKLLLALYVVALILVFHATTPLLYDAPRYPWVFKHIGVIDFIASTGGVDRQVDIYHNWPAFFALNAWLTSVTGLSPFSYAPWAQVFFNLVNVAVLQFALRGVTRDERTIWTATWLFVLGNWVGQDYLAPQALAFTLALVVLGLCLRCAPPPRPPRWRPVRWWVHRLEQLRGALLRNGSDDEPPASAPVTGRAAVAVGGLCYLAIVVTHQLTPVMVLAGVTGLALVRRLQLWLPAAMALVEGWWVALAWPYLTAHYHVLDFDPTSSGIPAGYEPGKGVPGVALVIYAPRVLFVVLALLTVAGAVRRLRSGRFDLAAATLVVAPLLIVLIQSYGGEARYRFYLLALPWLCFFAAAACQPLAPRTTAALRSWRVAVTTALMGTCFLFAYFGSEMIYRVPSQEVRGAVRFERHAPHDSFVVDAGPSQPPSRLIARYATVYDPVFTASPSLPSQKAFRRQLGPRDLFRVEETLRDYGAKHTFLRFARSQESFARLYGILPGGWRRGFEGAVISSPAFRPFYRNGSYAVYEYTAPVRLVRLPIGREGIRSLQRLLNARLGRDQACRGASPGLTCRVRVNGLPGSQTAAAIRSFQRVRGLRVTGRVDPPTLHELGR